MKRIFMIGILALFLSACSESAVPTALHVEPTDTYIELPEITELNMNEYELDDYNDMNNIYDESTEPTYRMTPYEVGHILIIMYHGIMENSPTPLHRSPDDFRMDLQRLYDSGYRTMPIRDLVHNNITVPAGYSPIIITFDDSLPSSFSLIEENGELVPRPNTAAYIMLDFVAENPDFGNYAVFFINGNPRPFSGAGTVAERLQFLVSHGFEIGNHTYSHASLATLNSTGVQRELAKVEALVQDAIPGYRIYSVAYPFGVRPLPRYHDLILRGEYGGVAYEHVLGLRAGYSIGQTAPNRIGFDPLNIPRIQGSHGYFKDLHWFLDHYDENPQYRFVSDGNPDTISVPKSLLHNVNMASIGDKILLIDGQMYLVYVPEIYEYYYDDNYDVEHDIDYNYYDIEYDIDYDYDIGYDINYDSEYDDDYDTDMLDYNNEDV